MGHQEHWHRHLTEVKGQLALVSPTFCLAKWLQATFHLQHGHTHSCHHPIKHKIPLEELSLSDLTLHNTRFKKIARKQMLQGEAPSECRYCWEMESATQEHFSDRIIKSGDFWAWPDFKRVQEAAWDADILPRYLELVFGSECQLRCAYCAPDTSSALLKEYEKHGAYPTTEPLYELEEMRRLKRLPLSSQEANPYLEAFWRIFPKLYSELKVLRITGGEPLLNENTFKLIHFLKTNSHSELEFSVNTNACVSDELFERFIEEVKDLDLKRLDLYASVDTAGKQAEYIRFGLDYEKFLLNIRKYLSRVQRPVTIMTAFSLFSLSNFQKLLEDVLALKKEFGPYQVFIDISWVCHPMYFSPTLMNDELKKELERLLFWMRSHSQESLGEVGFLDYEVNKFERLYLLVNQNHLSEVELKRWRKDFALFVQEYDKRKYLSFEATFPELRSFYQEIVSFHQDV